MRIVAAILVVFFILTLYPIVASYVRMELRAAKAKAEEKKRKRMVIYDIETFPDRLVFKGPDGETSTLTWDDAMAAFKKGMEE